MIILMTRLTLITSFLLTTFIGIAILIGGKLLDETIIYEAGGVNRYLDIYMLHLPSRISVNLTRHPATDDYPTISPDGSKIAFISDRDQPHKNIFILDIQTGTLTNITNGACIPTCWIPKWSPDGTKVTFSTYTVGRLYHQIHVKDLLHNSLSVLERARGYDYLWSWSPDGNRFIAELNGKTYIVDIGSGRLQKFRGSMPVWTKDSNLITYTSTESGNYDLYMMNVATGEATQLTNSLSQDFIPNSSPDGKRILYVSDQGGGQAQFAVFMLDTETRTSTMVVPAYSSYPQWR
jgi:Tol biopolymer transport system component